MGNQISNGLNALRGSGGSLNNQMYQNIHNIGCFQPLSGRSKRRLIEKQRFLEYRKEQDPTYGKPRHKNTNGFG